MLDLVVGRFPQAEADRLAAHVETCADCLARVQAMHSSGIVDPLVVPAPQPWAVDEAGIVDDLIARVKKAAANAPPTAPSYDADPTGEHAAYEPLEDTVIAGRYRLVQPIGEGGMGAVWVAEQTEPVRRRVAIKLIKPGMDSKEVLARFDAERQALAMMDHPNIAKVFDGGMTDRRRPYFVMELIRGAPMTRYCDDNKLNVRERLELFVAVCQAVQHAHQKGIIHRDLKPSNILVTTLDGRPVPKVIDFGVAKAVGGRLADQSLSTRFGSVVGTLEYMAPEQAEHQTDDVDTRADIYSLGVILYEVLTGLRPIDSERFGRAALVEMVRILREEAPSKPSTRLSTHESAPSLAALRHTEPKALTALLRGELDWVVMKCLEKPRDRRYETANGLARDIQRYLANEPVEARPPSATYRIGKFVQRHRVPVFAAGLVLLALVAGIAGTSWQAYRASLAAEAEHAANLRTQKRLAQIEKGVDLFAGMLRDINPQNEQKGGPTVYALLRERAEKAADELGPESVGDPLAVARLQLALGNTLRGLGGWMKSVAVLEAAEATRARELGPDHIDTIACRYELAQAYKDSGQLARSLPIFESTLKARESLLGPEHLDTLRSRIALGRAYLHAGEPAKATALFEPTLKSHEAILGPHHADTLATRSNLAAAYNATGRYDLALELIKEILKGREATLGPDHLDTIGARHNLGIAYYITGQLPEAMPFLESTARAFEAKLGHDHPSVLLARGNLAMAYNAAGRFPDAIATYEATLRASETRLGVNHTNTLLTRFHLGSCYVDADRMTDALPLLEQASTVMQERKFQHDFAGGLLRTTIMALERAGRVDRAEHWRRSWLAHFREKSGPGSPEYVGELEVEAGNSLREKNWAGAEPILRECLALREKSAPDAWPRFQAQSMLGGSLLGQKKPADAEPLLLAGYEGLKRLELSIPKTEASRIPEAIDRLILLYTVTEKPPEADRWRAERAKYPPAKQPKTAPLP